MLKLKKIAFILTIIGFLLILLTLIPSINGRVIGISDVLLPISIFIGLILVIIGIILFSSSATLEAITEEESVKIPADLEPEKDYTNRQQQYISRHTPDYLQGNPSLLYRFLRFFGENRLKEVHGKKQLPKGPKLYISTHRSPWGDAINIFGASDNQVHVASDKTMNWTPLRAYFMRKIGSIPVRGTLSNLTEQQKKDLKNRSDILSQYDLNRLIKRGDNYTSDNIAHIRTMVSMLMQGKDIAIMAEGPEMGRSEENKAYAGYALVAREYRRQTGKDLPIVPVSSYERRIAFGKPFYVDKKGRQSKEELSQVATENLHNLYDFLSRK